MLFSLVFVVDRVVLFVAVDIGVVLLVLWRIFVFSLWVAAAVMDLLLMSAERLLMPLAAVSTTIQLVISSSLQYYN